MPIHSHHSRHTQHHALSKMASPSKPKFTNICVFCGTSFGNDRIYMKEASNLGRVLAARKINLVYGGGSLGLMGCVSSSAFLEGSKVLGIVPEILAKRGIIGFSLGNEIKVTSMHERIGNMMVNADAFIALPGGFGTLEELFNMTSWAQLNLHRKPIGLLNVNGFYDGLLSFLDHIVEQGFMTSLARQLLVSAPTADQLIDELQVYVPQPDPLMSRATWKAMDDKSIEQKGLDLTLRL